MGKISLLSNVSLDNVLYVPDLAKNLISVGQICEKGYVVCFYRDTCKIFSNCKITGNQILTARKSGGLYMLQCRPISECEHSMSLQSRQGSESVNAASSAGLIKIMI